MMTKRYVSSFQGLAAAFVSSQHAQQATYFQLKDAVAV